MYGVCLSRRLWERRRLSSPVSIPRATDVTRDTRNAYILDIFGTEDARQYGHDVWPTAERYDPGDVSAPGRLIFRVSDPRARSC